MKRLFVRLPANAKKWFFNNRITYLLIFALLGFIAAVTFYKHSYFLLGAVDLTANERLNNSLFLIILSLPTLFVLWLYRTHDVKQQIEQSAEQINLSMLHKATDMVADKDPTRKSVGLKQLDQIKKNGLFLDEINILIKSSIGKEVNLEKTNLEGIDFEGVNLTKANLQEVNLQGVNLTEANLEGANLQGAKLQGAKLQEVNLQEVNLQEVNLKGVNLKGVNLTEANLTGANLTGANLEGANLTEANLEGANLTEANLTEANLEVANLTNADLKRANFEGADLKRANFEGADLKRANFEGAINLVQALNLPQDIRDKYL